LGHINQKTSETSDSNASLSPLDQAGSPTRFGYEWDTYADICQDYEEQFRRWTTGLPESAWKGCNFLDVGCGMGRNSVWPMRYGASSGAAIDLDEKSLSQARRNLKQYPSVTVRRLSVYDIDYADDFDIVYSIGVLHHLQDPQLALSKMVQSAKPGGSVLIWVYGLENNEWIVRWLDPLRKALFSKLPIHFVHALSIMPSALLWLLLRLGLSRIEYFRFVRRFSFAHLRSIVFDQMLPNIANYWSRAQVEQLMQGAALKDVRLFWINEMSWTAIGIKPTSTQSEL